jgi:hypothetical protein
VSKTTIPTMMIEDVELRVRPGLSILRDPIDCDHLWEPHLLETGRAYCPRCGSLARWINDPRAKEAIAS